MLYWIFNRFNMLKRAQPAPIKYCSLIQMAGTVLPVQNPSFKARGLLLIGSFQLHSHSPAVLWKINPNVIPRGAAHSTLVVGAQTLLQQWTRVSKPKEGATLPHGIHNALQHLLLYCELNDFTCFSVSPLSIHSAPSVQVPGTGRTSNVNMKEQSRPWQL